MRALIDADVLRYEIGHGAEYMDGDRHVVRDWEICESLFEQKIMVINAQTDADEPPTLFLTSDSITIGVYNRWAKTYGKEQIEFVPNFRNDIATVKPYKGSRNNEKPAHYANLTSHIINNYDFRLGNGVEADDLIAMEQNENTIICSRDKDLRQVPGNHYSWECGKQAEIGPLVFDKKGFVEEKVDKSGNKSGFGGGEMFFLYQLLVGDIVDNIPGCPKVGHVKALNLLSEVKGRKASYLAVLDAYRGVYGEDALTHLTEQARLLWLLRSKDEVWEFPYETPNT